MESTHQMLEQLAARLASGIGQPVTHRIVEHIWLSVVEGSKETTRRGGASVRGMAQSSVFLSLVE